ncbi:unnamed protein product [Didymodactylos carnosus]|uniref:Uncharacterized protein n=1 Tax=Didymodactylos carnosus TaxID=1234261 RepID=A0A816BP30_9BILA|nr:unnamed protein product [Didymodactylos carnosus]CAF4494747.1 unnamed protein product [Didymodactylos carnosus]
MMPPPTQQQPQPQPYLPPPFIPCQPPLNLSAPIQQQKQQQHSPMFPSQFPSNLTMPPSQFLAKLFQPPPPPPTPPNSIEKQKTKNEELYDPLQEDDDYPSPNDEDEDRVEIKREPTEYHEKSRGKSIGYNIKERYTIKIEPIHSIVITQIDLRRHNFLISLTTICQIIRITTTNQRSDAQYLDYKQLTQRSLDEIANEADNEDDNSEGIVTKLYY